MNIIRYRKIWYIFSGILIAASITALSLWGLQLGIDFTGGSLLEVEFSGVRPSVADVNATLQPLGLGDIRVQPSGEIGALIRMKNVDEPTHQAIVAILIHEFGSVTEKRFDSIGPVIGSELKQKSLVALFLVFIAIIVYIAWAFRRVGKPVASWKYGIAAFIALIHDALIPIGVFSVLGKFYGVELESLFVAALLTVIGFSVHDTIVVFDRIRENLSRSVGNEPFDEVVGKSVSQTITRSISTSLTTVLVMAALFFFGGASTKFFSLAFLIGVISGTYSSIFIASSLLVDWQRKTPA